MGKDEELSARCCVGSQQHVMACVLRAAPTAYTCLYVVLVRHAHGAPDPPRYQSHEAHSGFWLLLCTSGVTLISSAEVAGSDVTPEQAAAFIRHGDQAGGAAPVAQADAAAMEELDDME